MGKILSGSILETGRGLHNDSILQIYARVPRVKQKKFQTQLTEIKLQNGDAGLFMMSFHKCLREYTDDQVAEALNKQIDEGVSRMIQGVTHGPIITADNVTLWVGRPASFRNGASGTAMEWAMLAVLLHSLTEVGCTIEYNKRVLINGYWRYVDFVVTTKAGIYYIELKTHAGAQYRIDMDRHNGSPFFFVSYGDDYNQHMIDEMREKKCQPVYLAPRQYKRFIPPPINSVSIEDLVLAFKGDKPEVVKGLSRTA
jgi:hypothetical protein